MKSLLNRHYWSILAVLGCISLAFSFLIGMGEGRMEQRQPVTLSCSDSVLEQLKIPAAALASPTAAVPAQPSTAAKGRLLGSKNGTKYYEPSCAGAKRIKPENRVWFNTAEDAKLQGYTPGRC